MTTPAAHRGVAQDDARNRGPIALFRPQEVTRESARDLLSRSLPHASATEIETRVDSLMARIARGPVKPPAPLSQSLQEVDDPHYGLGTHPDIIERMWKLDDALPQRCRWVVWGKPGLVHPRTGVIFGMGFGTIGFVLRLPRGLLATADPGLAYAVQHGNPGQSFDIGPAGPEWRFISARAPQADWCRQAYDFAGAAA
jgi:hypothetical protein